MTTITTRRRFIEIFPLTGAALLAACSPKSESESAGASSQPPVSPTPAPPPVPAPAPTPAPTPAPVAESADLPMVDSKSPQAVALGYVEDSALADKAKYMSYVAGSQCSACALYLGKPGEASGGCPLFAGKKVAAKGWCSSWVKKA